MGCNDPFFPYRFIGSYIANGRDKGVDFFERFFSIFFVLNIRYSVFSFLAGIFIGIIAAEVDLERNTLLLTTFFIFFMTYKVITHVKEVSS